ncbi:MAG: hypothetical protein K9H14_00735 [Actinomycetia bacterium]|nr:hypothetical protein [Actinomycetes bacterium]
MKRFNLITVVVFILSILAAFGLDRVSSDYEFVPDEQPAVEENMLDLNQPISREQFLQFCQINGDPVKDGIQAQVIFLNPFQEMGDNYLVFQVMIDIYTEKVGDYKITDSVTLEDSKGRKVSQGFEWQEHEHSNESHIMGVLMVPNLEGGDSLLEEDVEWVKLTIESIDERKPIQFKWKNG